ncbi:MAG: helix-turn-helix domain-containing protein [Clostridia bacterium]|nr:helix-turn-helix domain-containing protein [Clostridia bacterium]
MTQDLPLPGEMLNMEEAGKILGISGRTVLRMAQSGKLKAVCYGPRMWRISRGALAAYMADQTVDEEKAVKIAEAREKAKGQTKAGPEVEGKAAEDRPLMSVSEAARQIGISPRGITQAIRRGSLIAEKDGKTWKLKPADVEAYKARRLAAESLRPAKTDTETGD